MNVATAKAAPDAQDAAQTATACRGKATLAGILAFDVGTVGLSMKRDEILRVGR
jgi:hypothetical protein